MRFILLLLCLAVGLQAEFVPLCYNNQILAVVSPPHILALVPIDDTSTKIIFDLPQKDSVYAIYLACPIAEVQRQLKEGTHLEVPEARDLALNRNTEPVLPKP